MNKMSKAVNKDMISVTTCLISNVARQHMVTDLVLASNFTDLSGHLPKMCTQEKC